MFGRKRMNHIEHDIADLKLSHNALHHNIEAKLKTKEQEILDLQAHVKRLEMKAKIADALFERIESLEDDIQSAECRSIRFAMMLQLLASKNEKNNERLTKLEEKKNATRKR